MKPQRGRIPIPEPDWLGLSVYGFITRTVADTALLLDTCGDFPYSLADAATRPAAGMRVAVSTATPTGVFSKPDSTQLGAVASVSGVLRDLGHTVVEREIDYGLAGPRMVSRYLAGIRESAGAMPQPGRLSRQTRGYARLGLGASLIKDKLVAAGATDQARIVASFGDADVVMTPMYTRLLLNVGEAEGKPAAWVLNRDVAYVPYPGLFNHTNLPAIAVPAGRTPDDVPLSVQIVARPDREDLLVALAAQLEPAIGWADARPAVAA